MEITEKDPQFIELCRDCQKLKMEEEPQRILRRLRPTQEAHLGRSFRSVVH